MMFPALKLRCATAIERWLPPSLLAAAVWPYIAFLALRRALGRRGRAWRDALGGMRTGRPTLLATWRHFVDASYLTMVTLWPARLLEPHWQSRITLEGFDALRELHATGTPVVIAVLHFTHMSMLRFVLRSQRIAAASLAKFRHQHPTAAVRNASLDRAIGFSGTPNSFVTADLRSAYDFLRSGNCLIVACDVASPASVTIETDLGTLQMATGPFRLAQMTGARIVPAILCQPRRWHFTVKCGPPLDVQACGSMPEDFRAVAEQCMQLWLPAMRMFPTQYDGGLGHVWSARTDADAFEAAANARQER